VGKKYKKATLKIHEKDKKRCIAYPQVDFLFIKRVPSIYVYRKVYSNQTFTAFTYKIDVGL
jgi:hypothetical protein